MSSVENTHYILGSVVGPHPFPRIVRDFQIRSSAGKLGPQSLERLGRLPDLIVACVGGGSNTAGMFYPFVPNEAVKLVGVEAGGRSNKLGDHAATLCYGQPGVLHGSFSYVLQDEDGQTSDVHSVSAGLDYPRHRSGAQFWKETGRYRLHRRRRRRGPRRLRRPGPRKGSSQPWKVPTPWPRP